MIQGYRLAGKGFPPKAQGHVSQPVQLKSKAKNRASPGGSPGDWTETVSAVPGPSSAADYPA
jgi:hypothetical protein